MVVQKIVEKPEKGWRKKWHEVIFEADTKAGKAFDTGLLIVILISVVVVMLESIPELQLRYFRLFYVVELFFTVIFSVEYIMRLFTVKRPLLYMKSFYGIVDLISIVPTFLELLLAGSGSLLVIRVLRLLRVFRIFKLIAFQTEARKIKDSLVASKQRIFVFLITVLSLVTIIGTLMYIIEDPASGFTSIPRSIYWAIVTLTTVGYGDIAPQTALGQMFASLIMILGYAIIAVPTGIVAVDISRQKIHTKTQACPSCGKESHDDDALHCKFCGEKL
jgi:voltage-gated potassium channel